MVTIFFKRDDIDHYLHNVTCCFMDYDHSMVTFKRCTNPQKYIKDKKYDLVEVPMKHISDIKVLKGYV